MVVSAGPWPSKKAEMNTLEINEELRPQRADNKHQFINTKEKYLVTQRLNHVFKNPLCTV
uniref:Uncharacterized protein n=1 Tax=Piliocolobus tephrosceles TaxID=591936 RepID=A0A8C9GUU9_9PRIM